eukprot:5611652-Pyramimonas_sp.AAC.1
MSTSPWHPPAARPLSLRPVSNLALKEMLQPAREIILLLEALGANGGDVAGGAGPRSRLSLGSARGRGGPRLRRGGD